LTAGPGNVGAGAGENGQAAAKTFGPFTMDLTPMRMGMGKYNRSSWLERMIGLRDTTGLFRLAFLETVLRAADARASRAGDNSDGKEVSV
jgi:hypothetical protein